jgi:hypothetical protein
MKTYKTTNQYYIYSEIYLYLYEFLGQILNIYIIWSIAGLQYIRLLNAV